MNNSISVAHESYPTILTGIRKNSSIMGYNIVRNMEPTDYAKFAWPFLSDSLNEAKVAIDDDNIWGLRKNHVDLIDHPYVVDKYLSIHESNYSSKNMVSRRKSDHVQKWEAVSIRLVSAINDNNLVISADEFH